MNSQKCLMENRGYRKLIDGWKKTGDGLQNNPEDAGMVGSLAVVAESGMESVLLMDHISETLRKEGLYLFSGPVDWIGFECHVFTESSYSRECIRLYDWIDEAGRFGQSFRGVLLIDLSAWQHETNWKELNKWLRYINGWQRELVLVYFIREEGTGLVMDLVEKVRKATGARVVNLLEDRTEKIVENMVEQVGELGLFLEKEAMEEIKQYLEKSGREGFLFSKDRKEALMDLVRSALSHGEKTITVESVQKVFQQWKDKEPIERKVIGFERD